MAARHPTAVVIVVEIKDASIRRNEVGPRIGRVSIIDHRRNTVGRYRVCTSASGLERSHAVATLIDCLEVAVAIVGFNAAAASRTRAYSEGHARVCVSAMQSRERTCSRRVVGEGRIGVEPENRQACGQYQWLSHEIRLPIHYWVGNLQIRCEA